MEMPFTFNSCPVAKSAEKEATCPGMVVSSSKTGSGGAVVYNATNENGGAGSVYPALLFLHMLMAIHFFVAGDVVDGLYHGGLWNG